MNRSGQNQTPEASLDISATPINKDAQPKNAQRLYGIGPRSILHGIGPYPFGLGYSPSVSSYPTNPYNSDISTSDTIARMIQLSTSASHSPAIEGLLISWQPSLSKMNGQMDVVRFVYGWVKRTITFTEDETLVKANLGFTDDILNTPEGAMDLLIAPEVLLGMPQPMGDCDDYSMLLASLLMGLRFQTWFVTIAADESDPQRFSHVYVKTYIPDEGREVYLDASHGMYPGWESKKQFRKAEWFVG